MVIKQRRNVYIGKNQKTRNKQQCKTKQNVNTTA